jgi:hypothetical protein
VLGDGTCVMCEAGQYSAGGTDTCQDCAQGTFSAAGSSTCAPCDAGTTTVNNRTAVGANVTKDDVCTGD